MLLADLFADGHDFSPSTIEHNRNRFYQRQTAHTLLEQMQALIALLTRSLQIHLNVAQSFVVNSSSTILALETVSSLAALSNKEIQLTGDVRLSMPAALSINAEASTSARYSIRVSDVEDEGDRSSMACLVLSRTTGLVRWQQWIVECEPLTIRLALVAGCAGQRSVRIERQ